MKMRRSDQRYFRDSHPIPGTELYLHNYRLVMSVGIHRE